MSQGGRPSRTLLPRLVRLRDAPFYLGMDRNRFNAEVRPDLAEIPIGAQGIAFDPDGSASARNQAKKRWADWWRKNRDKF